MDRDPFELRFAKPSFLMRLLVWVLSKRPSPFPDEPEALRKALDEREPPADAPIPDAFKSRFIIEDWIAEGQKCVTLHPASGKSGRHIIYFHGGGFILPMFKEHWPLVAALVKATGASVTVPLYEVVPEASYERAEALADAVFAKLAAEDGASNITLAGDSAGGNMAAALAVRLARRGSGQAGHLVLFAPWLDVTLSDEASRMVEKVDVMLRVDSLRVMGDLWAGERDPEGEGVSPLYASPEVLAALPPTAIFQGRHDIFVVDCRNFARKAATAGHPVQLYEYGGAPHVFMALTPTREAKDCLALVRDFVAG